jgi:hypothetical protein
VQVALQHEQRLHLLGLVLVLAAAFRGGLLELAL